MTELEAFVLAIDAAIKDGVRAEVALRTIVTGMAERIKSNEHLRASQTRFVPSMERPDDDNVEHLERHVRHALEDFESLVKMGKDNCWRIDDVEKLTHSVSHHLRHAAFRSGVELKRRCK
jgi:D-aminopeptidase